MCTIQRHVHIIKKNTAFKRIKAYEQMSTPKIINDENNANDEDDITRYELFYENLYPSPTLITSGFLMLPTF